MTDAITITLVLTALTGLVLVVIWKKKKTSLYSIAAAQNISTALSLYVMGRILLDYDIADETLVWIPWGFAVVFAILAVLGIFFKRALIVPVNTSSLMRIPPNYALHDSRIENAQDLLDMIGEYVHIGINKVVLYRKDLTLDFFDLKTGLAGEITQKLVNYHMQLAIVGETNDIESESFQAFKRECNKGNTLYFVDTLKEATERLR